MTYRPMGRNDAIEQAAEAVRRLTGKDFEGIGRAIEMRYRSKSNSLGGTAVKKKGGSSR
jgi:hypothetical protein